MYTDQLDVPAVRTSQTDQLDGPPGWTTWKDQLDRPAGRTSSFYLKPWPVSIFEDFPFSLYIVAASESDEGLVSKNASFLIKAVFRKFSGKSLEGVIELLHFSDTKFSDENFRQKYIF